MSDVQFRVGDLDAELCEAAQGGGEGVAAGRGAYNEVALETDAIKGRAGILDNLDGFNGEVCLGAVVLEVVVV